MSRKRNPKRDKAFKIWKEHKGKITNKAIAELVDAPAKTISAWKSRDKWSATLSGSECSTTKKECSTTKRATQKEPVILSGDLTDKQRLFCIYYIKSFNQTMAAIKAGYSPDRAHVTGSELVRNSKVSAEIRRLKGEMQQDVFIDAMDVLNKYIQIAFADITDYATFGKKEVEVMTMYGPLEDDDGNPIMKEVNYVDFNESNTIDGSIITEVKQGKDGISVKLADKMKALDMLSKYFDLLSDNDKKRLQEEKLKTDIAKTNAEVEKLTGSDEDGPIEIMITRKGDG